ncbi:MAG: family oxidoreductase [Microvirga sp.]|jgi:NAD(P)-dependent dehydrogenase (short-subunit alcohol dehydrogenase family)|nr:family oxidoreductase [Microvirga sp.]
MISRKMVLITGGSRGIGAATALIAAERGYDVCVAYRGEREAAESVVAEAGRFGAKAVAARIDLADETSIVKMFDAAHAAFGRLDGVVNNAGIIGSLGPLSDMSKSDMEAVFAVNVVGTFLVAREAVRRMSRTRGGDGGSIVNVSSRAGQFGSANRAHYAASKSAIDSLTLSLAHEVAADGIRVNAVSPGPILTDIHDASNSDRLRALVARVPMQRIGQVDEVAHAIIWLLSDEASYVSGAVLPISGGR